MSRAAPLLRFLSGRAGLALALGAGLLLRLLELLRLRSLWRDEASLALNLVERPLAGLLGPLDHDQVAPPLFLALTKGLVEAFGESELVLRALPFAAGVAALFLFAVLARRILGEGGACNLAVAFFALTDSLIDYSAELKPYSLDVAVALAVTLAALWLLRAPGPRAALVFALVGLLGPWLSHPAVLVLAGAECVLALVFLRAGRRRELALVLAAGAAWLAGFALLYFRVLRLETHNAVLDDYWSAAFAPLPPTSLGDLRWYVSSFFGFFTLPFGQGAKLYGLTSFVMLVGYASLFRARRAEAALLLAAVPFTLLASGLHLYPFLGRLLLFLVPFAWLGVAAGVEALSQHWRERTPWLAVLLVLMLAGHPILNVVGLLAAPRQKQEFRPVADHLRAHRLPGDVLYLSLASETGLRFYARRRLALEPLVVGTSNDTFGPELHRDLAALAGRGRVWLVLVWEDPRRPEADVAGQVALARLDGMGRKLDQLDVWGVRLCLYELAEPPPSGR